MPAIPVVTFVLFGIGLVWCVTNLVRGNRSDTLASGSVIPQQEINLAASGDVVVLMEVPRTAADFRGFQIELLEKQTGQIASTLKYSVVTAQGTVHGITTMKVPFGRIPLRAGAYVVRIAGLQAGKDYSNDRLEFSRPYLGRMALQIIEIVLCGVGMLLSLLWGLWLAGLLKSGTASALR